MLTCGRNCGKNGFENTSFRFDPAQLGQIILAIAEAIIDLPLNPRDQFSRL
jgi:hypothetical protein